MQRIGELITNKEDLNKELKKSFSAAKKDEKFSELVDKLKLSDEVLMKYTGSLTSSAEEYHNCMNCKGLLECKNKVCGYCMLPIVEKDAINFKYVACRFQKKYEKDTSYLKNIYTVNIPENILSARMKDIYTNDPARFEVIKYLKSFIDDPKKKGLYLHGNFGSGKTYLVAAALNELAKKDVKSAIVFWPEFLKHLKTLFNTKEYDEAMNKVLKAPILLIDDIGAENTTAWSRDEILCPILQYRMDEHLATFFTSNLNLNELETHLSITKDGADIVKAKRIIERVKQLTSDLEMISKNLRK